MGDKYRGGRPPGVPNRVTAETREVFKNLLENNLDKMQRWLDQVGTTDPAKALSLMIDLAGYCIPKLKSIEMNDTDPSIPILTAFDGVVSIPKDWPGTIMHIKTPGYTGSPLVAYVGPEGADGTAVSGPTSAANTE
jgi:hypothetical protein